MKNEIAPSPMTNPTTLTAHVECCRCASRMSVDASLSYDCGVIGPPYLYPINFGACGSFGDFAKAIGWYEGDATVAENTWLCPMHAPDTRTNAEREFTQLLLRLMGAGTEEDKKFAQLMLNAIREAKGN